MACGPLLSGSGVVPVGGVGVCVSPLAWSFPVGGVGVRAGGPIVGGVWSAGPRYVRRGGGIAWGYPWCLLRWHRCAERELFWDQPQVYAGCKAQVEFGCHAAEVDHLACLDAGELYPDA